MASVDSLEVQIAADAKSASSELDKIVRGVQSIGRALKSINTTALSSQFKDISRGFSDVDTKAFSNLGKSAKEAEKSIVDSTGKVLSSFKKVEEAAKRDIKRKISFDVSDYNNVIKELQSKFSGAGKEFKVSGNLDQMQKEADKLSASLEKLLRKQEKIISVGKMSPEIKTFHDLQYDIAETANNLAKLQDAISDFKMPKSGSFEQLNPDFNIEKTNNATRTLESFKKSVLEIDGLMNKNLSTNLLDTLVKNHREGFAQLQKLYPEQTQLIEEYRDKIESLSNLSINIPKVNTNEISSALESIPEKARHSVEKEQEVLSESMKSVHMEEPAMDSFRNFTKEIADATAKLKELEAAGKGMGSDEWDETYISLQKVKQAAKEYKAQLDNPSDGIEDDIKKTNSLGNKIEELREKLKKLKEQGLNFGDAKFDKTYSELNKAEKELKEYKADLNSAGKESKNFSGISVPNFQRVANSLKSMGNSVLDAGKKLASFPSVMKKFSGSTTNASNGFKSLKVAILSAVGTIAGGVGAFNLLKESIDLSSDLTEQQNVIDVSFGKYKKSIEDFAKVSVPEFGMSELTAKTIAGRFQSMGVAIGYSQKRMSDMSVELTKLAANMASFYNVEQNDVAKSLESVFTGTTEPLRKYGLDLTNATLEEWAHKQGVDAKMKSMSQAEKTMLRYQYVMSQTGAAQGDFARTANSWANQTRMLAQSFQQLGSILGGVLINALKPIVSGLNVVMQKVISFAKVISDALGQIFGWTYEKGGGITNEAVDNAGSMADSMDDVADATDKANKKQKEFNKQLAKFDELNNYTSNKGDKDKDKDKNGAGVDDLAGLGGGGKWKQQESILKKFKSDIKSLEQLGGYISEALSKAMEGIDWDSIYKKAEGFGTGLASFLNGLFTGSKGERLFKNLGKTIAGALNTAVHSALGFAKTFNWKSFGLNLASGVNSFFENFDWKLAAETFNTLANGILDAAIATIKGIKWKKIRTAIFGLINGIDFPKIGWKLGKLASSLSSAVYDLVSDKECWNKLGGNIAKGINNFFKANNWKVTGKAIGGTISGVLTAITSALKTLEWDEIGIAIGELIKGIDFGKIAWNLISLASSLITGIGTALLGSLSKAPIETALITVLAGLKLTGLGSKLLGVAMQFASDFAGVLLQESITGKIASGIKGSLNSSLGTITAQTLSPIVSPFLSVLTGALAIGALAYTISLAVNKDEFDAAGKELKKINDKTDKLNESLSSIKENIRDTNDLKLELKIGTDEGAELQVLTDQYMKLAEKTKLSTTEKKRLKEMSQKLIEKIPELKGSIDEETGAYKGTKDELQKLVNKTKEYYKIQAAESELAENAKTMLETRRKLEEAIKNEAKATKEYNKANKEYLKGNSLEYHDQLNAKKAYDEASKAREKAASVTKKYRKAEKELTDQEKWLNDFIEETTEGIDENTKKKKENKKETEKSTKATEENTKEMEKNKEEIKNTRKEINDAQKKAGKGINIFVKSEKSKEYTETVNEFNQLSDKLIQAKVQGWPEESFKSVYNEWKGIADKTVKTIAKGDISDGSLEKLDKKWRELEDKKVTSSAFGDVKKSFTNLYSDWKETRSKTVTATLKAEEATKWPERYTKYKNLRDKTVDATLKAHYANKATKAIVQNPLFSVSGKVTAIKKSVELQLSLNGKKVTGNSLKDIFSLVSSPNYAKINAPKAKKKKDGGAFYGGSWHNFSQYASGGSPSHGTAFVAGEAGPEIVGHIGGRTEVLNQSQLASTMYASVAKAIRDSISPYLKRIVTALTGQYVEIDMPITEGNADTDKKQEVSIPKTEIIDINSLNNEFDTMVSGWAGRINELASTVRDSIGQPLKEATEELFTLAGDKLNETWSNAESLLREIPTIMGDEIIAPVSEKTDEVFEKIQEYVQNIGETSKEISDAFKESFNDMNSYYEEALNKMGSLSDGFFKSLGDNISSIQKRMDNLIRQMNDLEGRGGKLKKVKSSKGKVTLKAYAAGGFPEDGLFYANHNELVGTFSNGKTAVANNTQITQGIATAVSQANEEGNALMRQEINMLERQNELLYGILQKETGIRSSDLVKAVKREDDMFRKRTGRGIFAY